MITPELLKQHNITPDEYQLILQLIGRQPNLVELGIFSVMWSEHCSYKSSRKFLKGFPTKGPRVLQGPGENAGIVDIGDGLAVVFKMESHNHPSFIEPYQGAATGVGGILRDVFTMGARPIANLNSLRFGSVDHPKTPYLVSGVVSGIAGYGNCMGIPTVGGDVVFDPSYNGNILVNAMTVGLVEQSKIFKGYASGVGNPVFYVGAKTGRDGIHGATMASDVFDDKAEQKRPTVQVGDPFTEKKLLEACLELMQTDCIVGIQDMGAAGLTSSSFEMASRAGSGIEMNLDLIPTREEKMTPYEMMLSESQERMLLVAKKGREEEVKKIFVKWDLDASPVGVVTDSGRVVGWFKGEKVFDLPILPITDKAPVYDRPRKRSQDLEALQKISLKDIPVPQNLEECFLKILGHPNNASKKWVYRQYDHQVMTNTLVLPGSDAAVLRVKGTQKGLAVTSNCNSRYCYLDPRTGGHIAVAESGRNLVCSGAKPLALTDCLNFGNPERPEIMDQFVECIEGISEACRSFDIPVISGNVSFYNETNGVSIYPTPMIGMVGLLEDVSVALDQFYKNAGDIIVLLGETKEELGASEYLNLIHGKIQGFPPKLCLQTEQKLWNLLLSLIESRLLKSAHDISEGGLSLTLAESCFGGGKFGVSVKLEESIRKDLLLFSESQSRVVVSLSPSALDEVKKRAQSGGVSFMVLGEVVPDQFVITSSKGDVWIKKSRNELEKIWSEGFEKGIFGM
ncbi:MAG TPA: phosphoribosylformylglycinamidine synthase subunit PurL [Deltaproteobacteria bacterium]|nr:MAG: phosphoribosylformylglycinamidine synthase II [Deltaproteobacteria bacterium GWA2_45_12]HBF12871.1 phosphoribosylformylglycinamidine synthase subunit PurL [Deltaproteobacteria bacterium]